MIFEKNANMVDDEIYSSNIHYPDADKSVFHRKNVFNKHDSINSGITKDLMDKLSKHAARASERRIMDYVDEIGSAANIDDKCMYFRPYLTSSEYCVFKTETQLRKDLDMYIHNDEDNWIIDELCNIVHMIDNIFNDSDNVSTYYTIEKKFILPTFNIVNIAKNLNKHQDHIFRLFDTLRRTLELLDNYRNLSIENIQYAFDVYTMTLWNIIENDKDVSPFIINRDMHDVVPFGMKFWLYNILTDLKIILFDDVITCEYCEAKRPSIKCVISCIAKELEYLRKGLYRVTGREDLKEKDD